MPNFKSEREYDDYCDEQADRQEKARIAALNTSEPTLVALADLNQILMLRAISIAPVASFWIYIPEHEAGFSRFHSLRFLLCKLNEWGDLTDEQFAEFTGRFSAIVLG